MIERQLKYSHERHKPISIIYTKGMEIIQRKIQVLKIEHKYIKALDIDKGAMRTFTKDNILSAYDIKTTYSKGDREKNLWIWC